MSTETETQNITAENCSLPTDDVIPTEEHLPDSTADNPDIAASADTVTPENDIISESRKRDEELIAALDEVLVKRNVKPAPDIVSETAGKFIAVVSKTSVGVISLALILILMGIVMICCLFSGSPDYLLPVKLSPIAVILIGLEILLKYLTAGKSFRVYVPAIAISAVVVAGCCFTGVALNKDYTAAVEQYDNRSVAGQIYEASYKELRYIADVHSLNVTVNLNPDGKTSKEGIGALSPDDEVKIDIELSGKYTSVLEFAEECKKIVDSYRILGIPVSQMYFKSISQYNEFRLIVDGSFMQDLTAQELSNYANFIYIEDYDYISDLEDFYMPVTAEATTETGES